MSSLNGCTWTFATVPVRRLRKKTATGDVYFREPFACAREQKRQRCHLRISSNLPGAATKYAKPPYWWRQDEGPPDYWEGHCPCCKRPLEFWLREPVPRNAPSLDAIGKYAFVINLWGSKPDYVLGALVLGHSIRRTGSRHALVCLHTDDVSKDMLSLLSRVWECRQIEHVEWDKKSLAQEWVLPHFSNVFTKLRALALVEFAKVLVLDIDILVLSNIDDLFELTAPAATKRGTMLSKRQPSHGSVLDAKWFYKGRSYGPWSWGQASGINAGVMLWQPNLEELDEMLDEIKEPNHPEHCKGNGPEQDYLTRYWSDAPWHHIGVEYNYQVHHALLPMKQEAGVAPTHVNLLDDTDKIKIVHYSATKPWSRLLDPRLRDLWPNRGRDADYVKAFLADYFGEMEWVERILSGAPTSLHSIEQTRTADNHTRSGANFPREYVHGVYAMLERFLAAWFDAFQELQMELQVDLLQEVTRVTSRTNTAEAVPIASGAPEASTSKVTLPDLELNRFGGDESRPMLFRWNENKTVWKSESAFVVADSSTSTGPTLKLTVFCMAGSSSSLLVFMEGGSETCRVQDENGIFVKLAGSQHKPVRFQADLSSGENSFEALKAWVAHVPRGVPLMFAALAVPTEVLSSALDSLGCAKWRPTSKLHTALAAAGLAGIHESWSTHASETAAYAAVPIAKSG